MEPILETSKKKLKIMDFFNKFLFVQSTKKTMLLVQYMSIVNNGEGARGKKWEEGRRISDTSYSL
jgi:hypothetical protein